MESFSCSFLEPDEDFSFSRLRSLDELEEDDDDDDFEDLCLDEEDELRPSLRSLSLLELELELERDLSLSRCLSLELRCDEEDELFEEELLDEDEDDDEDLWLDDEDLWLLLQLLLEDFLSFSRSFSDLLLLSRGLLCFLSPSASASSPDFNSLVVLLSSKIDLSEPSILPLVSAPASVAGKELSSSLYRLSADAAAVADLSTVLIVITRLRFRSPEAIV